MKKAKPNIRSVTPEDEVLGHQILARRLEIGMPQHELGEHLGVSFQQVQKYEKGTNRVTVVRLNQIAAALGVPVSYFYKEKAGGKFEKLLVDDGQYSVRLLQAYSDMEDNDVRRHFVSLLEAMVSFKRRRK